MKLKNVDWNEVLSDVLCALVALCALAFVSFAVALAVMLTVGPPRQGPTIEERLSRLERLQEREGR